LNHFNDSKLGLDVDFDKDKGGKRLPIKGIEGYLLFYLLILMVLIAGGSLRTKHATVWNLTFSHHTN